MLRGPPSPSFPYPKRAIITMFSPRSPRAARRWRPFFPSLAKQEKGEALFLKPPVKPSASLPPQYRSRARDLPLSFPSTPVYLKDRADTSDQRSVRMYSPLLPLVCALPRFLRHCPFPMTPPPACLRLASFPPTAPSRFRPSLQCSTSLQTNIDPLPLVTVAPA